MAGARGSGEYDRAGSCRYLQFQPGQGTAADVDWLRPRLIISEKDDFSRMADLRPFHTYKSGIPACIVQ